MLTSATGGRQLLFPSGAPVAGAGLVASLSFGAVRVAAGRLPEDAGQDRDRHEGDDRQDYEADYCESQRLFLSARTEAAGFEPDDPILPYGGPRVGETAY